MCAPIDPVTAIGTAALGSGAFKGFGDNFRRTVFGMENPRQRQERESLRYQQRNAHDTAAQERRYAHELAMADRGYGATGEYRRRERDTSGTGQGSKSDRQTDYNDRWRNDHNTWSQSNPNRDALT